MSHCDTKSANNGIELDNVHILRPKHSTPCKDGRPQFVIITYQMTLSCILSIRINPEIKKSCVIVFKWRTQIIIKLLLKLQEVDA
jgi:hypothetical protein